MGEPRSLDPDQKELQTLLQRWFEAAEAGERLDPLTLCGGRKDVAERLTRLIERGSAASSLLEAITSVDRGAGAPVRRLGDFVLGDQIGAGGMAVVYAAEQTSLRRPVALKILNRAPGADDSTAARFRREAEITAALDHPNIVPVYTVGEERGFSFIAMKHLSGPALCDVTELPGPIRVAEIGIAVASALAEAHDAGVIHRDVKPGNIILDDSTPYLVDFGLARSEIELRLTGAGTTLGTLPYMSPEQLSGDRRVLDARTDIYSLGAALYEALEGRPPFRGDSPEALIRSILSQDPPRLGKTCDRDLETIVLRALDKEPRHRFGSAQEMADDLERFVQGRPIHSRPIGPFGRVIKSARRHPRVALLLAGVLALGAWVLQDRVTDQRAFMTQAAHVESRFAALDTLIGDELLSQLRRRRPGDPEVRRLEGVQRSASALVDLLDTLQGRSFLRSDARLRRLLAAAEAEDAPALAPRLAALGFATANLHLNDPGRALVHIEKVRVARGDDRSVRALRAVASGRDPAAALAAPSGVPDDAHSRVFAALALRLADRPLDEVEKELDEALKCDLGNRRARFALASLQSERGQSDVARASFLGLVQDGRIRANVLRSLAWQEIFRGDLEAARLHLSTASDDAPELTAAVDLEIAYRTADPGLERDLADALTRWPDDVMILSQAARVAAARGRVDEARSHLLTARRQTRSRSVRRDMDLTLLELDYRDLPHHLDENPARLNEDQAEDVTELIDALDDFLSGESDPALRSRALLLRSRICRLSGRRRESWEALSAARCAQERPAVPLRFALLVAMRGWRRENERLPDHADDVAASGTIEALLPAARAAARLVIESAGRGLTAPTSEEIDRAWFAAALLAWIAKDEKAAARAARAGLDRAPDAAAANAAGLRWLLEQIESPRPR